jgi:hypothetical protein
MGWLTGAIAWVYDFLAEDTILLVGGIIAIIIGFLAVHMSRTAAGYILWVAVVLVIVASLWRTVSASKV